MNFHKTKIEWCSHTWNPVSGCYHGCTYCYARRIAERFGRRPTQRPVIDKETGDTGIILEDTPQPCYTVSRPVKLMDETGAFVRTTPYPMGFAPTFNAHVLGSPAEYIEPARVFVCSMADLFGEWVPDKWIEAVFDACKAAPQHTYLFLTKNPGRYGQLAGKGKLPDDKNFWYGVTATDHQMAESSFRHLPAGWRYNLSMSVEPMQGDINLSALEQYPRWLIIGGMTGPGSKNQQPRREWVDNVIAWASARYIPVFMKDSMAGIWGPDLIREYPSGMKVEKPKTPVPRCLQCEYCEEVQQGARGKSRSCAIGWSAEGYDDRGSRHIEAHYARISPLWCPLRRETGDG